MLIDFPEDPSDSYRMFFIERGFQDPKTLLTELELSNQSAYQALDQLAYRTLVLSPNLTRNLQDLLDMMLLPRLYEQKYLVAASDSNDTYTSILPLKVEDKIIPVQVFPENFILNTLFSGNPLIFVEFAAFFTLREIQLSGAIIPEDGSSNQPAFSEDIIKLMNTARAEAVFSLGVTEEFLLEENSDYSLGLLAIMRDYSSIRENGLEPNSLLDSFYPKPGFSNN